MDSNEQIILACKKGSKAAFRQLYEKHSGWMMGMCLRYCKNTEDAQDVLQECLVKIFTAMDNFSYHSNTHFCSWLKKIIINTSINFIKNKSKSDFIVSYNDYENENFDTYDDIDEYEMEQSYTQEDLLRYIQELPDGYRTVFNLYVFEDKSHKEISDIMNISESTSKSQLFKARSFLKNKISKNVNNVAL
jgi:RNA polymerase sigma-70 factor (ECF subfamily)